MWQLLLETIMQMKKGQKVDFTVPLKHLLNWETLDIPLINCEVSSSLSWSANCVTTSLEKRQQVIDDLRFFQA